MDVIDIVRTERPDAAPMDAAARADLRARLTRATPEVVVSDEPTQHDVEPSTAGATPVRWWLSVAAIVLVGACLAAVIMVVTRPEAAPPVAPPPTPADPGPLYPSATVPVVESLPDPFEAGELEGVLPLPVAPATTAPPANQIAFAPLALSELPDGYSFGKVGFEGGGDGGFGIVRYTRPGSTTQLHLTIRDFASDYFDELDALGRRLGEFAGRTVYDDGQGGGCLPDFCSIGFLWDDGSYVSISWVEPNAGDLDDWATLDSLLPLVAAVVEDPELWVEWAGAVLPPPTTVPQTTAPPASAPTDRMPMPPLAITGLPAGYVFDSARFDRGEGGTAVVRYTSPVSGTELRLVVRDSTAALDAVERSGRLYRAVEGVGLVIDDEGPEGCSASRCSIGWAWDLRTHVSVIWIDPDGDPLDASATQDALVELAASVVEDPTFWETVGAAVDRVVSV